jgi:hypothetical protein
MIEYEILVSYLRESNFNEDGSPSDDDDYFKVIRISATSKEEALKNVEEFIFNTDGWCGIEEDYVEGTLDIIKMLSAVGHNIKQYITNRIGVIKMEHLRKEYENIINAESNILKEIEKEVSQMNEIALHNYANSIVRNCSIDNINRNKAKATGTTLVYDLIMEIIYRQNQEENQKNQCFK